MDKRITKAIIIPMVITLGIMLMGGAREQTAHDLLNIYGVATAPTVEVEAAKLDSLENDYDSKAADLYNKQLLQSASSVGQQQLITWCKDYDSKIHALEIKMAEIDSYIKANQNADAETIIKKDSEYAVAEVQMNELTDKREQLSSQLPILKAAPIITGADTNKVTDAKTKLDKQRKIVTAAKHYAELGEVSSVRHPADDDLHINSGFGTRWDPVTQRNFAFHKGVDFRAPMGTKVLAVWNGTVEAVTVTSGGGKTIWINHGTGIKTVYMHLSAQLVNVGQRVNQYDVIALSGNTGSSTTGPHLHFGLYINGDAVNPEKINWR